MRIRQISRSGFFDGIIPRTSNPVGRFFAKLIPLWRNADAGILECTWQRIGDVLDRFTLSECANLLRRTGHAYAGDENVLPEDTLPQDPTRTAGAGGIIAPGVFRAPNSHRPRYPYGLPQTNPSRWRGLHHKGGLYVGRAQCGHPVGNNERCAGHGAEVVG